MAKCIFFKKQGRQTSQEVELISDVRSILSELGVKNGNSESKYHKVCSNVEELRSYKQYLSDSLNGINNPETHNKQGFEENINQVEKEKMEDFVDESFSPDFDPMEESVIQRDYTKGDLNNSSSSDSSHDQEFSDMANNVQDPNDIPEVQFEEIIEEDEFAGDGNDDLDNGEKIGGDNLQDMSPSEKRKACRATAISIVDGYASIKQAVGIKACQYDEDELFKLDLKGEIDLNEEIQQGLTFGDYVPSFNERVKEAFVMTPDEKESIIDPLTDVLMQNDIALTPMQRLVIAFVQDVAKTAFAIYALKKETRSILEFLKESMAEKNKIVNPNPVSQQVYTSPSFQQNDSTGRESVNNTEPTSSFEKFDPFQSGNTVVPESNASMNSHEEILDNLSIDVMNVISPEHDPNVTIEEQ